MVIYLIISQLKKSLKVSGEDIRVKPKKENNADSNHDFVFGFEWRVLHYLKLLYRGVPDDTVSLGLGWNHIGVHRMLNHMLNHM